MVQCVSRRLLWCPCDVVFLWLARCAGYCRRDTMPPSPKGQQPASRQTSHLLPTLQGAHAERSPRPLVLSPFGFCGSRRQWVVNPRTRVSGALAVEDNRPSRRPALLEPETTKGQPAPRVYKSPWNPRPQKGNRPSCLQKFLDLEPSRATGPRDYHRTFCPRPPKGNRPSCLQKQLQNWTTKGQPVPQESRSPRLD